MMNVLDFLMIILLASLILILYGRIKGKNITSMILKIVIITNLIMMPILSNDFEPDDSLIIDEGNDIESLMSDPYTVIDLNEIPPPKESPLFLPPDAMKEASDSLETTITVSMDRLYNWGISDDFNSTAWQEECDKKWLEMLNQSNLSKNLTYY